MVAVVAAAMAPEGKDEDLSMPGTESQEAFDLLDERFPQSNSPGAEARLVFRAPDGQRVTARENRAAVEDALGSLDGGDQVASTTDPYETGDVSEDGTIAYSTITCTADAVDLTEPTKSALEDAASQAREAGLTVEIGGSALDAEEEPGGTTEIIGVVVAAVVLVLALGSVVAAGLSLLTAFVGVAIAFGLVSARLVPTHHAPTRAGAGSTWTSAAPATGGTTGRVRRTVAARRRPAPSRLRRLLPPSSHFS
ncbi:MMPL family transporter [Streptomyces hygroscopicus]|uniref:MMPL family transporter n=1 Tax=Streptomyces hygroscopicus TaxID=1912 RepID=UPI000829643A|nr:MMPL family transporter [Streptomyces hygroscopicus]